MNKNNREKSDVLNELYQRRKEKTVAPAAIKSSIFSGLKRSERAKQETNWFRLLSGVALAASTLLFVVLVSINQKNLHTDNVTKVIEVHRIQNEPTNPSERILISYQKVSSEYMARTQQLENFHRKTMLLTHFDAGWELENCDETIVQVSNQLVEMLSNGDMLVDTLPSGSWVEVFFDQHGHIRKIVKAEAPQHCT